MEVQSQIFIQTPPFKETQSWTLDPDEGGLLSIMSMESFNKKLCSDSLFTNKRDEGCLFFGLERCNIRKRLNKVQISEAELLNTTNALPRLTDQTFFPGNLM